MIEPVKNSKSNTELIEEPSLTPESLKDKYIESYMNEFAKSSTDSTFRLNYNKSLLSIEIFALYDDIMELKAKYEEIRKPENYKPPEEIDEVAKKLNKARELWFYHIKDLIKFDDAQVSREMPKKIEVTNNSMSIQQFSEMMSKATKTIDAKEVNDGT